MRKLSPAYVVTSVVIAAGAACAQAATATAARSAPTASVASGAATASRNMTATVPATPTSTTGTSGASATTTGTGTNTTGATSTTSATSSTGLDGSRSGNNTDSSAANIPIGSTSANGNSSVNSATNSTATTVPALAPGVTGYINPAIINGAVGVVTNDGERILDNSGQPLDENAKASANVQLQDNGSAGASVAVEAARSSQSYDRAIKQVEKDRRKIGRNGQLLQSIAPRTNVDRTNEMPDDAPSPALTGSSSTLTRP